MKIDLSKVTIIKYSERENEFDLPESFESTSNRNHTLLFQSRRIIKTNSGSSNIVEPSNDQNKPEMSKLTFLNVFDNHRPEEIEKLDRLWMDCKGTLPSRRQLSAIAQSIGIQQSKIKKWFDKRKQEQTASINTSNATNEESGSVINVEDDETFWKELNLKLDQIDTEINKIESLI